MFYAITEKYSLKYVLAYNILSPNVSLFSQQAYCNFVLMYTCVRSKYCVDFVLRHNINYINSYLVWTDKKLKKC